jgi:hypothetical protein
MLRVVATGGVPRRHRSFWYIVSQSRDGYGEAKGGHVSATKPIEVRDMRIIHETFRRAYEEAAPLIRANPTPSPARVTFLADHIDFGLTMLHHHHEGEDEILYPLLVQRVPDHATRTEQIDHEHQVVKGAIDAAHSACSRWRAAPAPESAEALARSLDEVNAALLPHLDNEEREIVPLAAVTVTQEEWDSLAKHGIASIPGNKKLIAFGMILEPLNPADRVYMLSNVPPPVKVLYRLVGQRAWRKYATTLRSGT